MTSKEHAAKEVVDVTHHYIRAAAAEAECKEQKPEGEREEERNDKAETRPKLYHFQIFCGGINLTHPDRENLNS